jgi:hypothetical protein
MGRVLEPTGKEMSAVANLYEPTASENSEFGTVK